MNVVLTVGTVSKVTPRTTSTGSKMLCFTLTTQEMIIGKDGTKKEVKQYLNFVIFGSMIEANQSSLQDGAIVSVRSRLNNRKGADGNYRLECEVQSISVLSQGIPQQQQPPQYAPPPQNGQYLNGQTPYHPVPPQPQQRQYPSGGGNYQQQPVQPVPNGYNEDDLPF